MTQVSASEMAAIYWLKMKNGAFREVAQKRLRFEHATLVTVRYWEDVHNTLLMLSTIRTNNNGGV